MTTVPTTMKRIYTCRWKDPLQLGTNPAHQRSDTNNTLKRDTTSRIDAHPPRALHRVECATLNQRLYIAFQSAADTAGRPLCDEPATLPP